MTDGGDGSASAPAALSTFAEKLSWLIDRAHPAGRTALGNAEIAALVRDKTGEKVSHNAIWELRTGKTVNPTKRLIEALATTFGVPAGFFFDDYGDQQTRMLAEEAELLGLIRRADADQAQLRAYLNLRPEARRAMSGLIEFIAQGQRDR